MSRIITSLGLRIIGPYSQSSALHRSSPIARICCRSLFTAEALGIEKLRSFQENRRRLWEADTERYISRLRNYVDSNDFQSLIKEDFINLLALTDNEEHLDLVEKIISCGQLQEHDLGGWGATLARIYFNMNQIDRAYRIMTDPNHSYHKFFNQMTSYQVIMTMLFDAGRYDDVIALYNLHRERSTTLKSDFSSIRKLSVLVFASYTKMGTPEAFEKAIELYELDSDNPNLKARTVRMLGYLAYKTGKDTHALNLVTDAICSRHIVSHSIKALSLFRLKRYEDVLIFLRRQIADLKDRKYKLITLETHDNIRDNLDEIQDGEIRNQLSEMLNEMSENQLLEEKSVDDIVFAKIQERTPQMFNREDRFAPRRDAPYRRDGYNSFGSDDETPFRQRGNFRVRQGGDSYRERGDYQSREEGFRSGYNPRNQWQRRVSDRGEE